MDVKGLRTLNLVGTILYGLIGTLLVSVYYYQAYRVSTHFDRDMTQCTMIFIIWLVMLTFFTILLYINTVAALGRGNYKTAKRWTLVGIIIGFMGGIIPLIIFIISYVSFDEAIRPKQFGHPQMGYYPPPGQVRFCDRCRKQIPFDSKLCPYCGVQQTAPRPPQAPPQG
jgi:hypothetical protein